jgi:broad specificity phosphatase PhoE
MADRFFAHPGDSIEGWERAVDGQARIVAAVAEVVARTPRQSDIAIVSHGGVGALLLCHVTGAPISRAADQPGGSGGHVFAIRDGRLLHGWRPIDG